MTLCLQRLEFGVLARRVLAPFIHAEETNGRARKAESSDVDIADAIVADGAIPSAAAVCVLRDLDVGASHRRSRARSAASLIPWQSRPQRCLD